MVKTGTIAVRMDTSCPVNPMIPNVIIEASAAGSTLKNVGLKAPNRNRNTIKIINIASEVR